MAMIELVTGDVVVAQDKSANQLAHIFWGDREAPQMMARRTLIGAAAVETVNGTVYVNGDHVVRLYDDEPESATG